MARKTLRRTLALALLVLLTGCSTQQVLVEKNSGPLHLRYDIQYVDSTALGVEVLVLTSHEMAAAHRLASDMDRAFNEVAYTMPKSEILMHQDIFRDRLTDAFALHSEYAQSTRLLVVDVFQTTWQVDDQFSMLPVE